MDNEEEEQQQEQPNETYGNIQGSDKASGFKGFLKHPFGMLGKGIKGGLGKFFGKEKLAVKVGGAIGIILVILVCIVLYIIIDNIISKEENEKTTDSTRNYNQTVKDKIASGEITGVEKDRLENAMNTFESKHSYMKYTIADINEIYDRLVSDYNSDDISNSKKISEITYKYLTNIFGTRNGTAEIGQSSAAKFFGSTWTNNGNSSGNSNGQTSQGNKYKVTDGSIIYVGDSRTVGLQNAIYDTKVSSIAQDGEGLDYFKNTALPQLKTKLNENVKTNVVLALGLNDLNNIDGYIDSYRALINEYKDANIFVLSVNPVNEGKTSNIKNSDIEEFNKKMKTNFPNQYIDTYSKLKDTAQYSTDGILYVKQTYKDIHKIVKDFVTYANNSAINSNTNSSTDDPGSKTMFPNSNFGKDSKEKKIKFTVNHIAIQFDSAMTNFYNALDGTLSYGQIAVAEEYITNKDYKYGDVIWLEGYGDMVITNIITQKDNGDIYDSFDENTIMVYIPKLSGESESEYVNRVENLGNEKTVNGRKIGTVTDISPFSQQRLDANGFPNMASINTQLIY